MITYHGIREVFVKLYLVRIYTMEAYPWPLLECQNVPRSVSGISAFSIFLQNLEVIENRRSAKELADMRQNISVEFFSGFT